MSSLLLKITVKIPNAIFSGLKYTLQSTTQRAFDDKTGLAAEVKVNMLRNHKVSHPFTDCSSFRVSDRKTAQVRLWDLQFQALTERNAK